MVGRRRVLPQTSIETREELKAALQRLDDPVQIWENHIEYVLLGRKTIKSSLPNLDDTQRKTLLMFIADVIEHGSPMIAACDEEARAVTYSNVFQALLDIQELTGPAIAEKTSGTITKDRVYRFLKGDAADMEFLSDLYAYDVLNLRHLGPALADRVYGALAKFTTQCKTGIPLTGFANPLLNHFDPLDPQPIIVSANPNEKSYTDRALARALRPSEWDR